MKRQKGCWTCRARKVKCDGQTPTCKNCARLEQRCQGYGMRLSWPSDSDTKRAIVRHGIPMLTRSSGQEYAHAFFINTTWRDVEVHRDLSHLMQPSHSVAFASSSLRQPHRFIDHMDLIHYFLNWAYQSLNTFDTSTRQIRDTLIRMALSDNSDSGLALLFALLAYTSLHRSGLHEQAIQLKTSALHFLSMSLKDSPVDSNKAAQHVAASMLLGAFGILLPSENPGEWVWHIWGAMEMIKTTRLRDEPCRDIGHLLDWVYYHDVLSRFAVHHWRDKSLIQKLRAKCHADTRRVRYAPLAKYNHTSVSDNPRYKIFNLLGETCHALMDAGTHSSPNNDYNNRISALREQIQDIPIPATPAGSVPNGLNAIQVYKLVTMIYLVRASQGPIESALILDSLVEAAFQGPIRTCTCPHLFPLFILACEARSDEQRIAVLEIIARVSGDRRSRNVQAMKDVIRAIWAQQDLNSDTELLLNYMGVLSAAISASGGLPSFV